MIRHEPAIDSLRRRIGLVLFLKYALHLLTAWAFLWGTVVLVLRLTAGTSPLWLLWGLAAVPVLLALALVPVGRRLPAEPVVRALLDRAGGCGGLLLAAAEQQLGPWEKALPPPASLRVRWHGRPAWVLFGAGVLFVLAGLLLPERVMSVAPGRSLDVSNEAAKLASEIDLLKKEEALEPERADELKEKLGQLKKDAAGESPAKTLEALDHLQNVVAKTAQEAGESAVSKSEDLAKAEALAEGMQQAASEMDPKMKAEAMAELATLAQKAAAEDRRLQKGLDRKLLKEAKAGRLSPEQMKQLARTLRGRRQDLEKMLDNLAEARLIDAELLKACARAGQCDSTALAKLLKGMDGKMNVADMLCKCQGQGLSAMRGKVKDGRPGRGGLTEGPGATELTFGDRSSEEGLKFKEQALPPSAVQALKESRLAGLGKEAPTPEKGGTSRPGALGQAATGGGSANTPVVLPRHRATVGRYFDRPAGKSPKTGDE